MRPARQPVWLRVQRNDDRRRGGTRSDEALRPWHGAACVGPPAPTRQRRPCRSRQKPVPEPIQMPKRVTASSSQYPLHQGFRAARPPLGGALRACRPFLGDFGYCIPASPAPNVIPITVTNQPLIIYTTARRTAMPLWGYLERQKC